MFGLMTLVKTILKYCFYKHSKHSAPSTSLRTVAAETCLYDESATFILCRASTHQKLGVGSYTEELREWFNYPCTSACLPQIWLENGPTCSLIAKSPQCSSLAVCAVSKKSYRQGNVCDLLLPAPEAHQNDFMLAQWQYLETMIWIYSYCERILHGGRLHRGPCKTMEMPAKNCQNWLVGTCMKIDACLGQYSTQNNTLFACSSQL